MKNIYKINFTILLFLFFPFSVSIFANFTLVDKHLTVEVNNRTGRLTLKTSAGIENQTYFREAYILYSKSESPTSFETISIDKKKYVVGDENFELKRVDFDGYSLIFRWKIKGLTVTKFIYFSNKKKRDIFSKLCLKYKIVNNGRVKKEVGIKFCPDFDDSGRNIFLLPEERKSFDCNFTLSRHSGKDFYFKKNNILIHCWFPQESEPEQIIFCNWEKLVSGSEKIKHYGDKKVSIKDFAAVIEWQKEILEPGEKREYEINIGLERENVLEPAISVTAVSNQIYNYRRTPFLFKIKNLLKLGLENLSFTNLNRERVFTPGKKSINYLNGYEEKYLIWNIQANTDDDFTDLQLKLSFNVEGNKEIFNYEFSTNIKVLKREVEASIEIDTNYVGDYYLFKPKVKNLSEFDTWEIVISDINNRTFKRFMGKSPLQNSIKWNGRNNNGKKMMTSSIYRYYLSIITKNKRRYNSNKKMIITEISKKEIEDKILIDFPAVNFNYNSAALKMHSYLILNKIANLVRSYKNIKKVRVNGHTDNIGNREKNKKLSLQRAEAVRDYLAGVKGFPLEIFEVIGFGEERPVAMNKTESGREKNRRVEIIVEK